MVCPREGEFFHFTWGLERKQGPWIWGIITFFFYSKANAPYFPGVGVSIDRCISSPIWHILKLAFVIAKGQTRLIFTRVKLSHQDDNNDDENDDDDSSSKNLGNCSLR